MTTVLNRDSIKVKRDLQRRVEDYVIKYCEALEENFKQYSLNSYKRNIHENILEDCFEVAMESFRINNKLTQEQLDELITISKGTYDAICSNAYKLFQDRCI